MERCVYCGKALPGKVTKARAHTREFDVCSGICKEGVEAYIKKDKKYKFPMFLMILAGGIGFLISAVLGHGANGMLGAYLGQIIAGAAFLFFPYPILSFETFFSVSIKSVTRICRILGAALIVWGIILLAVLFNAG